MSHLSLMKRISAVGLTLGLLVLTSSEGLRAASKEEAEKYAKQLKTSKDPKVKIAALEELGKLGQLSKPLVVASIPDMVKALDDKDVKVQAAAARALGKVDPPSDVIPTLIKMTQKDKPAEVRTAAIDGLAAMGPSAKTALPELRKIQKDEKTKDGKDSKLGMAARDAMRAINQK